MPHDDLQHGLVERKFVEHDAEAWSEGHDERHEVEHGDGEDQKSEEHERTVLAVAAERLNAAAVSFSAGSEHSRRVSREHEITRAELLPLSAQW